MACSCLQVFNCSFSVSISWCYVCLPVVLISNNSFSLLLLLLTPPHTPHLRPATPTTGPSRTVSCSTVTLTSSDSLVSTRPFSTS